MFLLQSGCRSSQAPSESQLQALAAEDVDVENVPSPQVAERTFLGADSTLDSAFNAGLDADRTEPHRQQDAVASSIELQDAQNKQSTEAAAETAVYTVQAGDHLWGIARKFGTTVRDLQAMNALDDTSALQIGQQLSLPAGATVAVAVPPVVTPAPQVPASGSTYQVVAGDNLSKIAKRFNTRVATLKRLNGLTDDRILVGDTLVVPGEELAPVAAPAAVSESGNARMHVVVSGEYPSTIAKRYGLSVQALLDANGISDPRKLQVGQKLIVGNQPAQPPVPSRVSSPVNTTPVNTLTAAETLELNAVNPAPPSNEPVALKPVQAIAEDLDALVQANPVNVSEAPDALTDEVEELFESAIEIPVIRVE